MIGRTHGVHAEPMTLRAEAGAVVRRDRRATSSGSAARASTVSVGKLSGAVGTFAHLPPSIEADVCGRLGLEPAPVASQVIQRDRHAELLAALAITAASLEKFALEIRGLQKTEIGEIEEPFAKGQKGSSAMPHKRNPIGCEQIVGLARLIRGNCHAAFENIALWHERDISHSSVERVILPDSFIAVDHMLRRMTRIVRAWSCIRSACARTSSGRAAWCSRARCCWNSQEGRLARAGLRVGPAQRDAIIRMSSGTSRSCCWRIRTSPASFRRPRSSARSILTSSSDTSIMFSTGCSARLPSTGGGTPAAVQVKV